MHILKFSTCIKLRINIMRYQTCGECNEMMMIVVITCNVFIDVSVPDSETIPCNSCNEPFSILNWTEFLFIDGL